MWAVCDAAGRDCLLVAAERGKLYRTEAVRGARKQLLDVVLPAISEAPGPALTRTVEVTISPNGVAHRIFDGKSWRQVDAWQAVFVPARFRFDVSGDDRMLVSNLAFHPN